MALLKEFVLCVTVAAFLAGCATIPAAMVEHGEWRTSVHPVRE